MVNAFADSWTYVVGGHIFRACGPIGRAVQADHNARFLAEVTRLAGDEFTFRPNLSGASYLFVPGTDHAYVTYSGLGEEATVDTDLWTAHVVLTYSTEDARYEVLSEKGKVGIYRSPEFCAALVVNAVRAHRALGFAEVAVTEQYTRADINLYAAVAAEV